MTCTFYAYEQLHAQPEVVAAVHTLLREVEQADGVAALSEAFLKGIDGDHGHHHIVAMAEERAVGVLALDGAVTASVTGENPTAELAVAPDRRRQGVARGLLAAAKEHLGLTGPLDAWAHGDLAPARAMAEAANARRTRELHKMAVDASPGSARGEQFRTGAEDAASKVESQGLTVLTYPEAVERFGEELVDEEWVRVNNEAFAWHPEQGG